MTNAITIKAAETGEDFLAAKALILEYTAWLGIDLSFQNFDKEMDTLQEMYSPADGGLFIALRNGQPVGVIGLRRFCDSDGEIKRMFVQPGSRGFGIGQLLITTCIEKAKGLAYNCIKLDTADFMKTAIQLYTYNGFVETSAYRYNPHEAAKYFELDLKKA